LVWNQIAVPDGFNVEFYHKFWDLLKNDLMLLLNNFHEGKLNIDRFNNGVVTLVPKSVAADKIQNYRPICLLNVIYKIVTKILTNILIQVVCFVIRASQTAFLKGRYILEGGVVMHETLNEIHREKRSRVLFKIDFEKAFDKIKWP
jgi:mannosylglycoprotein endo-beta-mannosidase